VSVAEFSAAELFFYDSIFATSPSALPSGTPCGEAALGVLFRLLFFFSSNSFSSSVP